MREIDIFLGTLHYQSRLYDKWVNEHHYDGWSSTMKHVHSPN